MTAFVATDVTYSLTKQKKLEDGRKMINIKITFGNSTLTYPANGIPLTLAKLGCPVVVDSFNIDDDGASGYSLKYDYVHKSIRMFQTGGMPAHTHGLVLKDAAVADTATARVNLATGKIGANTGGDITIAGAGASGGIANVAAASDLVLNELSTSAAPAAQTYKCTVIGY